MVELRHNRRPHHVLFKDQVGSLLAVAESVERDNFPAPRKGMIMVNAAPTNSCTSHQPSIAVCWSFSISNLVWIAPVTSGACFQPNSTVGIHTGNVMQYARVLKSTLTSEQLTSIVDYFKSNSDSVVRIDPLGCAVAHIRVYPICSAISVQNHIFRVINLHTGIPVWNVSNTLS